MLAAGVGRCAQASLGQIAKERAEVRRLGRKLIGERTDRNCPETFGAAQSLRARQPRRKQPNGHALQLVNENRHLFAEHTAGLRVELNHGRRVRRQRIKVDREKVGIRASEEADPPHRRNRPPWGVRRCGVGHVARRYCACRYDRSPLIGAYAATRGLSVEFGLPRGATAGTPLRDPHGPSRRPRVSR